MLLLIIFLLELILLFFLSRELTNSLSTLFHHLTKNQKATVQILSFLFLPGIVVHELAHMLVASILFVKTGHIEFVPQVTKHGVKLGSVQIAKTDPIRRMLIGFAPVLVGVMILFGVMFYIVTPLATFGTNGTLTFFIAAYVAFEIGNTMFSSRKDMEGTIEVLAVTIFIAFLLYILGVRVDISFLQNFFSDSNEFLQKAAILLSLPIIIDTGLWGLVSIMGLLGGEHRRSL